MALVYQALLVAVTAIAVVYLPSLWQEELPVLVVGRVEPGFEAFFETFREHYSSKLEPSDGGSAFVAYHKGKKVVDIWGGYADKKAKRPWKQDTLSNIFSSGKGVAAICIAMLVDRGLIDYDEKVVKYWPEFGKHGKQDVTIKMLLSHQAAIPYPNETLTWDLFRDHERLANVLADSVPQWKIGSGHGYHLMTMASFCSVLLYKVDPQHRTLGQFVQDELKIPFGIDIFFGLPEELHYRTTRIEPPPKDIIKMLRILLFDPSYRNFVIRLLLGPKSLLTDTAANMGELTDTYRLNDPDIRLVEVPSSFGIATADGLAKLYGILANGGEMNGKQLLSPRLIKQLNSEVSRSMDKILGQETIWGPASSISTIEIGRAFGHSGSGGQEAWANPELKLSYSFLTVTPTVSLIETGSRYLLLRDSLYECVKKINK